MDPLGCEILIVDDEDVARAMLRADLEAAGCRVREARTSDEALIELARRPASIVITDWLMPGMSGIELCRAIRAERGLGFVYVIMLTVNGETRHLVEAYEAGVDDFLPKPFEPGVLLARMRAATRVVRAQEELALQNRQLEIANQQLRVLATTDELTGIPNRRAGLARLHEAWDAAERYGQDLACATIDVDHFKRINDEHGHAIGDELLCAVVDRIERERRVSDFMFRLGGEEFLLILFNQSCVTALFAAERIRAAVEGERIRAGGTTLSLTVSIGVAMRTAAQHSESDLLRDSDRALYLAKADGRNCCRGPDALSRSFERSGRT